MHEPTLGSLFSGCGGLDLGLERGAGVVTRWQCQYDPDSKREQPCNGILERHWPGVPNLGDITAVDWAAVEPVDVLAGGFPCQDLSYAGRGAGIADGTRSRLWFEFAHAIRALRPRVVVVENVPGLITRGLGVVLADLAEAGYDASWGSVRAADVGAPHRRERVFVVAADSERLRVNADRRLRGGGQGEHAGPARAAVPAGPEVACATDAFADRADAPPDTGRVAGAQAGELDGGPGARSVAQACGNAREAVGGVAGRDSGGSEAPADAGSDGLVRVETVDGAHGGVEVEPGDDADGRGVGDAGAHDGHEGEAVADAPSPGPQGPQPTGRRVGGDEQVTAHADGEHAEPRLGRRAPGGVDARAGAEEHDGDGHMGASEPGSSAGRKASADTAGAGRGELKRAGVPALRGPGGQPDTAGGGEARDEDEPSVEWGVYDGAVRQWEAIFGFDAPRPTDDRGRLAPEFVEWMLGYPAGWTAGVSRTARLKMLGNSVQVQVAEFVAIAVAISLDATA